MFARHMRKKEHGPELLTDGDVSESQPSEQSGDRHCQVDMPGHLEPVALAVEDEGDSEQSGYYSASQGEA